MKILCVLYDDPKDGMEKWVEINRKYSETWPVTTKKKEPPKDWKQWNGVSNKYKDHFSEKPGTGE